jgi:hypothetical protein
MKPLITLEFLRGMLVAYVAYECYIFGCGLWIGLFPRLQPFSAGASDLALAVYIILFLALLFRPARSAKAVFVFLSLFCLLQIGSNVYWLSYPVNAVAHRPLTIQLYRSLFMSIAVGLIVYVYYRISQQQQKV